MLQRKTSRGFSLLELMLCLSLASFLMLLAYPSFHNSLARGHCLEIQAALLKAASELEQYYSQHHSYQNASLDSSTQESVYFSLELQSNDQCYQLQAKLNENMQCKLKSLENCH